ncbi:hypothetical protein HOLleu_01979 [Holothuria leucospilota]|uniref:Uncharacterized protein n=1 Tax=Holothuria leucospilota TaxID=206669 RepID=A0A9Q1CQN3_HOLLE|nr:hypothetical protein HOLleu_01979 [Holothuria leucospilota]
MSESDRLLAQGSQRTTRYYCGCGQPDPISKKLPCGDAICFRCLDNLPIRKTCCRRKKVKCPKCESVIKFPPSGLAEDFKNDDSMIAATINLSEGFRVHRLLQDDADNVMCEAARLIRGNAGQDF